MRLAVRALTITSAVTALVVALPANAQARYPERPVKVVVAFAAGGNNDVPVRIVSSKLAEKWGTGVIVDNKAGAGGIIGTDFVAKAAPDGYTLANCNSATHGVNPALHKKLPYDAIKNFAPVAQIGSSPNVLIVPANSPLRTAQEFLAQVKREPGKMSVGTAGIGSTQHFSLEVLKSMTGTNIVHVPFKGGSLALSDVMAAQIPAAITGLPTALPAIKAGKVRALAVTSVSRSQNLRDVPTFAESGVAGYEVTSWTGLCAPAGTPTGVIERLNTDLRQVLDDPDTRQKLLDAGVEPTFLAADRFGALLSREIGTFTKIVQATGMQPE